VLRHSVLGLPYVPKVLFYELLDSFRGYLLDGDLLFYRLYLGLRLFGGRTLVHEFRIVKGRTSFEAKMESGKANSFKSPAEAEHESWLCPLLVNMKYDN
jgi:hypothetical protein